MVRRSVFMEARASQGRTGKPRMTILDELEEKEARASRMSIMGSSRRTSGMSAASEAFNARALDCDLEKTHEEFPMETLWLEKSQDNKRLGDYKKFREMSNILKSMSDCRGSLRNKTLQNDADLIMRMYKIYLEDTQPPKWLIMGMTRIHNDKNFQDFARNYWEEQGDDADAVDFDELDEETKADQRRRRSCMVQNMVSLPDERKTSDFSVDVDTRATRRSSITEEERKGDDDRKKSMMLTMNKNLMKSKDSRRTSMAGDLGDGIGGFGGKRGGGSRKASFAGAAGLVMGAAKWQSIT